MQAKSLRHSHMSWPCRRDFPNFSDTPADLVQNCPQGLVEEAVPENPLGGHDAVAGS